MTAHTKLVNDILVAIYRKYGRDACVQRVAVTPVPGRRGMSVQPGTADIIGCVCGVPVAIEAKVPPDKQRPAQEQFEEAWLNAGGLYFIVGSAEEALLYPLLCELETDCG